MIIKIFQKGFNYSQDGPGNRLVYHLQGCNMRCPWCSNPEGIDSIGTLMVNHDLLIGDVCPHGAIHQKQIDRNLCVECNLRECISRNRNLCIRLSSEEYKIESIMDEVKRSSVLFYDGGGVTLTGGEATMQFDAVKELLKELKEAGINTAMETNATHPLLEELFSLLDFLIIDFKHYDNEKLSRVVGVGNKVNRENVGKAFIAHKNLLVRIPLIKGFNDSEEDINNFATFFKQFNTDHAAFEFLPFHEYGKVKWQQCGMTYKMKNAFIEPQNLDLYKKIFRENSLKVVLT